MGGGAVGGRAPLPPIAVSGANCATPIAGARNVVYPEPNEIPGRITGVTTGACRVTVFPIKSVPLTVTFASSDGAFAQPNTVQPPFSAKQSA
jgi:hypothetical protein